AALLPRLAHRRRAHRSAGEVDHRREVTNSTSPDGFASVVPDVADEGVAGVAGPEVGQWSPDAAVRVDGAGDAVFGDADVGGFAGAAVEGAAAAADKVVVDDGVDRGPEVAVEGDCDALGEHGVVGSGEVAAVVGVALDALEVGRGRAADVMDEV